MNENTDSANWIARLKNGDADAASWATEEFFQRLVQVAFKKLQGVPKRVRDEEDIALSALKSAVMGTQNGEFPNLSCSSDLWRLLLVITARKISDYVAHETCQKRGSGNVRGESVFRRGSERMTEGGIDRNAGGNEDPVFEAAFADQLHALSELLPDDTCRHVLTLKLANYSNQEIAEQVECGLRSVERKLRLIRTMWNEKADSDD